MGGTDLTCDVCGQPLAADDQGQRTAEAVVCEHCANRLAERSRKALAEFNLRADASWAKYGAQWVATAERHAGPTGWMTLGYDRGPDGRCQCAPCRIVRERTTPGRDDG